MCSSAPSDAKGYVLRYRANNNFEAAESAFGVVPANGSVTGDTVTFQVPAASLLDGYYTLGLIKTLYMDDNWSAYTAGQFIADADPTAASNQPAVFGQNAFAVVNGAIAAAVAGDTIIVNAGTLKIGASPWR